MNRNTQAHFAETPSLGISRSKFDRSFTHKTSFNAGDIIPFFCTDILPGDTMKMNTAQVIRMMTPITPVMDNANLDTYFFFVPNRLIWDHWQEFMGENKTAPWIQQVTYEEPQIVAPAITGWTKGSLADYFGFPTNIPGYKASAMPFRAYVQIWNDWFRDENLKNPCYLYTGDSDTTGVDIKDPNYDYVTDTVKGAAPCKAAKYHDYFTAALPNAQKGPAVKIPIGATAPVIGVESENNPSGYATETAFVDKPIGIYGNSTSQTGPFVNEANATFGWQSPKHTIGLAADLSQAVGATINQLRQAFQIQKFFERQAIGGTRYIEVIKSHYSVTNPDFRMQRAEYLGGIRTPININQVVQTDATSQQLGGHYDENNNWVWAVSDLSPQGNTAAYSLTSGRNKDLFTHSFTEHGWVIGLAVVRTVHTYQQGLNKMFSRKSIFDYYWPEFANLGNMKITNKELYLQGPSVVDSDGNVIDEQVFGYQEAWAEYRYMPDIVTGEMRSNYAQSLDIWHWADDYNTLPALGSDWIDETKDNIARTLAVQDHDQFMGDFYFQCIMTRPMPLYSVPGLIDHH